MAVESAVIAGAYGFICCRPPRCACAMHAGMPGARLWELRENGRFGHLGAADEFAATALGSVHDREMGYRG